MVWSTATSPTYKARDDFTMGSVWKQIDRLQPLYSVFGGAELPQILCHRIRITGDVDDARRVETKDLLHRILVYTRPGRIDYDHSKPATLGVQITQN